MRQKLSILIVTTGYPRYQGDVFGVFVEDLCKGLTEKGIEIAVLAPHEPGLPFYRNENGIDVFRMPYFFYKPEVAYGSGIPSNLKKLSCKFQLPFFISAMSFWTFVFSLKYQVVHAQWSVSGVFALMSQWILRRPLVLTFRGSDLNSKGVLKKISHFVSKRSNVNICVAEAQQQLLEPVKSELCPNLIDTTRFKPVSQQSKNILRERKGYVAEDFLLVFVGYLIPVKRPMFILEVIKSLSPVTKLMILGEGELKEPLRKKINELDLGQRVSLPGQVPYHEIHEYFQMADLHIMASESEGRPNVVYQAMACGLPSLATAVGGLPEMIDHDQSGFLLEPEVKPYMDAIMYLQSHQEIREAYGQRAYQKLIGFGNHKDAVLQQHLKIYEKVLEK